MAIQTSINVVEVSGDETRTIIPLKTVQASCTLATYTRLSLAAGETGHALALGGMTGPKVIVVSCDDPGVYYGFTATGEHRHCNPVGIETDEVGITGTTIYLNNPGSVAVTVTVAAAE